MDTQKNSRLNAFFVAFVLFTFSTAQVAAQTNALHFDGIDDEVYFATAPFGPQGMGFSIEFWAKRDRTDIEEVVLGYGNPAGGATNGAISIGFNAANEFFIDYGGLIQTHAWANDTEWHHWAVATQPGFGTDVQYIYLDGQAVAWFSDPIVFDPMGSEEMVLGRSLATGAHHFQGLLDELRVHGGWLSGYWFSNFNACTFPVGGFTNGQLGYYTFDQGIANGDNSLETQLMPHPNEFYVDEGTLTNFALNGTVSNWVPGVVVDVCPINLGVESNLQSGLFENVCVNETINGYMYLMGFTPAPGNQFILELSDATGDFASPTVLLTIDESGGYENFYDVVIPIGTSAASDYRVRGRCTDPVIVGLPSNAFQIAIGDLSGSITIGGLPVSDGSVTLYSMNGAPAGWAPVHQATISSGSFAINGIYHLPYDWAMLVTADPIAYPEAISTFFTYSGPIHRWDAPGFNVAGTYNCYNPNVRDLEILEQGVLTGTSTISGYVLWPDGKRAAEDPIPLIDVVLERVPPSSSYAMNTTGLDGGYVFDLVPESAGDEYQIYVNYPGIPMFDTYAVEVTSPGMAFENLNFIVDTIENFIYPYLVTADPQQPSGDSVEDQASLHLQPNPADHGTIVTVPKHMQGTSGHRLHASDGRLVGHFGPAEGSFFLLRTSQLATGVYVLQVQGNDGSMVIARVAVAH